MRDPYHHPEYLGTDMDSSLRSEFQKYTPRKLARLFSQKVRIEVYLFEREN